MATFGLWCSGARIRSSSSPFFDVAALLELPADVPETTELNEFHAMSERFRTMPKATIAVIEGRVGGGASELTLSCDMRFAALGRAVFNQPEVALGIIPGGTGAAQREGRRSRHVDRVLPDGELWPFVERPG
jgi:enoyl-CoA hydratase/carnithine racemase